ncbi:MULTISPECIES: hypothetical protein [Flavobacterium]|uniref:DUF1460 domain-containing protein n=2 Tax=Flavobacterium jumunjinense TaxID=998845 RepID=A0ABV5GPC5_9FLAO|nr:hypothetical protein [Flavobacterium sp. N1861]
MKFFSLFFFFMSWISLNSNGKNDNCFLLENYNEVKTAIRNEKLKLLTDKADFAAISIAFENNLVNKIFPFWYGTKWSFEGYSNVPNQGEIACGYFVSTTLKHIGINVNRYMLAQQLPINEAYSLSLSNEVINIKGASFFDVKDEFYEAISDGVYFIGINRNHVGFIYRNANKIYIIHSNYFSGFVEKELIEESQVLQMFSNFYLVPISSNKELMSSWINNKEVKVVTSYK